VSDSIKVSYTPEEDTGPSDEEDRVSSGSLHKPRLLAATVTGVCVLAAAFLGGAFRE
ncbi:Ankyrin repeat protein, partial [Giardia duodenalis]